MILQQTPGERSHERSEHTNGAQRGEPDRSGSALQTVARYQPEGCLDGCVVGVVDEIGREDNPGYGRDAHGQESASYDTQRNDGVQISFTAPVRMSSVANHGEGAEKRCP